ncbi:MAG TPA: hypothetical protein VIL40_01640 [Thermaerobacter sp.]
MVRSVGQRREDGEPGTTRGARPRGVGDRGRPAAQPVPWEAGDRWLIPVGWVDVAGGAPRLSDRGVQPPAGSEESGPPPASTRHAIAYLTALDEPVPRVGAPTAGGDPAPARPGDGARPTAPAPLPAAVPRVLLAAAEPEAVAPLWGLGLHGVLARDPDHLRALLDRADRRVGRRGPRWVLLPWDVTAHPGLWARGWARVVEWAPGAVQPVIVPRPALAAAGGGEAAPAGATCGRTGAPGGPTGAAGPRTASTDGAPRAPAAGAAGPPADPGDPVGGTGWLRGAARARTELLRHLEEFVPAPVVIPVADAPPSPTAREVTGLAGVPVWWLWPPRGADSG